MGLYKPYPHSMIETPHGIDCSFVFCSLTAGHTLTNDMLYRQRELEGSTRAGLQTCSEQYQQLRSRSPALSSLHACCGRLGLGSEQSRRTPKLLYLKLEADQLQTHVLLYSTDEKRTGGKPPCQACLKASD